MIDLRRVPAVLLLAVFFLGLAGQRGEVRLAGHSLGNQVAVALSALVSELVDAGRAPATLLPRRVALLDPYWSRGPKDYLGGRWPGERVREAVAALRQRGVVFEQYKSSQILDLGFGDQNLELSRMVAFVELHPDFIPFRDQGHRHSAATRLYFLSRGAPPPGECAGDPCRDTGEEAPSASAGDDLIAGWAGQRFIQVRGQETAALDDDRFQRLLR